MIKTSGQSEDASWRLAMIAPALLMIISGICCYCFSDDCPQGNTCKLQLAEECDEDDRDKVDAAAVARNGFVSVNAWILSIQCAACFGVGLHFNNSLAFYLYEGNNETRGPNILNMEMVRRC